MKVQIKRVGNHALPLPRYETHGAAGCDLRARIEHGIFDATNTLVTSICLEPGESVLVPVGFAVAIPEGYEGQVRGRSGLTLKHQVIILGSPGTIDSDYRGEVHAMVHNVGTSMFTLFHGDRFAQLVIAPVVRAEWEEVADLPSTERGTGGFGSTGMG